MTDSQFGEQEDMGIQGLPVVIHAQYVKDLSFENPQAPETLRPGLGRPDMEVNIGLEARKIDDPEKKNLYEIVLHTHVNSKRGGMTAFIIEISYALAVSLDGLPENQHHPMLLIEMPKYAFPFVRQIIADLTHQGGYAPLLLTPVDFKKLYLDRFAGKLDAATADKMEEKGAA